MRLSILFVIAATVGCSRSPSDCTVHGSSARSFSVTRLVLPAEKAQFAADLDGDGKLHNALGNIVAVLVQQNTDPQGAVDRSLSTGAERITVDVQSSDSAQRDAAGAGVTIVEAMGGEPGRLCGELQQGTFEAAPIRPGATPVELSLSLAFLGDVHVPLTAVTTQFAADAEGHLSGQINGAARADQVWPLFGPSLAAWLNQKVAADPHGQIALIFDDGGRFDSAQPSGCPNLTADGTPACRNLFGPDVGQCAVANDGVISTCEAATSPIIANLGAPDVRLFAADGSYCPGCRNVKDALSFGVGFTAVP